MTSPPSDPVPSDPGARHPATASASSGAIPKKCSTCGTFYSSDLCPKCVVGFAGQPTAPTPPEVTPYGETVQLTPKTDRRQKTEPAIPDEALAAPSSARFGKFIRTLRLGAGGMGEVWKAWDSTLGRWVALKFLKGGDDDEVARFRREAQTAGRLHHPNIAAIYEVNQDQGRQYIAMQFVDGQNLHQFPRTDRALLVRLVADAARALHYAHEQGVIHRDLKPENLMVTLRGTEHHVYLMDFGLARAAEGASRISATGFLVGTPMYMSPEQARGEKVDLRSDVYSLGLTLYELLTDRKPFESESVYETLRRVQEIDPPAMRQIDRRIAEDLETVVMKAISKDPASRYATAQALADDLHATLRGEAIQGRRESLSRKLLRRVRRHPFVFATAAVLAIGLAVSGAIAVGASRDRKIIELTTRIEDGLRVPEWTEANLSLMERIIADLGALAPAQAAAWRARLPQALADSIRAADLARARQQLALLERLDSKEAARLRAELRQRESIWPGVFTLEAPFVAAAGVFGPGRVQAVGDLLRCSESGSVRTRTACEGNVQLKAEFDSAWKESARLGLMLNVTDQSGYQFVMNTADGPAAPSFGAVHDAKGSFRLQIRRGDLVLRDEEVNSESVPMGAPLRMMARRQGDQLSVQVNDLNLVEFRDPFALGVAQKGVFGIAWPAGVGVRRLLATHEKLAVKPSLLDVSDDLFLQGKFEEALDRYGEAAQSTSAAVVREEALYKQGLCNLQLNREEAAKKIFEGVAAGFLTAGKGAETRWYFLSDCQLLVLYFREKDGIDQATAILNKLTEYRYGFDQLALLMPPDVQRQVLLSSQTGSIGGNFHRRPEDHVARTEFSVRACELLEPPSHRGEWEYHHLMRAYMMVGRTVEALRTAEKSFRIFRYGGEVLDDYCWVRRLSGDVGEIRAALAAIDRGLAVDSLHLVERARIHLALQDPQSAVKDLDAFLATSRDYHSWSAACLLLGFVLERQGAPPEQVGEVWRRGLPKNWQAPKDAKAKDQADFSKLAVGMPMLHYWIMASLLGDMTDADAEQLLAGLTSFAGKDNPVFNKLMRPSMLRAAWRTPRAREVARHIAFRDVPFADIARWPLFVGWIRFVHEVCFNGAETLSPDQDELLWRMSEEIYTAYREGTLTDRYMLPFGAIVAGNPHAPGMGWREVATLLEKSPRLRGPLAYVFGQRYVKKGDPKTALMFFRAAASDADRDPSYPLLQRLARTEIDALAPK
jgi:tetratricopeptide (TPR) repeat protein/predicted Ser/Thr protein kinase